MTLPSRPTDAFPRVVPTRAAESLHNQQPQHLQCALYRPDSSSFAASLRELEKVGGTHVAVPRGTAPGPQDCV